MLWYISVVINHASSGAVHSRVTIGAEFLPCFASFKKKLKPYTSEIFPPFVARRVSLPDRVVHDHSLQKSERERGCNTPVMY